MTKSAQRPSRAAGLEEGVSVLAVAAGAAGRAAAVLPEDAPSFITSSGRGYAGKTTIERLILERATHSVLVADADRTNKGVGAYAPGALKPASSDDTDVRELVTTLLDRVIVERTFGMLDLGAGDRTLPDLAYELQLARFLTENGVRPVLIHMLGPDRADLDMLKVLELPGVFSPPDTAIFFNSRLLTKGARPDVFQRMIDEEPVLQRIIERGAHVAVMPTLAPAAAIEALGTSFRDAARGIAPSGKTPLGPTARQQVTLWLDAIEAMLQPIASWLP